MKFVITEIKTGKFLNADHRYTDRKVEAMVFRTEDEALRYCRKHWLLSNHVPVAVPKEQLPKSS